MENGELREQASVAVPGARFLAQGYIDGDDELDLVGVGDVLWTALSSRPPRELKEVAELTKREPLDKPVINEILARNDGIPLLIDFDKQADYVELFNGSGQAIWLGDWRLELDTGSKVKRYTFPRNKLWLAGQHLLLICSQTKRTDLHTGFKLPGSGATLTLRNAEGEVVDRVVYPPQQDNIAYSRYRDALPSFVFNPLPTPNAPNRDGGVVEPDLKFSGFDGATRAGDELRFTAEAADDIGRGQCLGHLPASR